MFTSSFGITRRIGGKGGDYQSIALALRAAKTGDVLIIRKGNYRGTGFHSINWPRDKHLVIRAEADSLVTIDCVGNTFITFPQSTNENDRVRGLKIINASPAFVITKASPIIQSNVFIFGTGIKIVNEHNNHVTIKGNIFRNMGSVLSQQGGCGLIQGNEIIRCSSKVDSCLIYINNADSVLIKENIFLQNRITLVVSDSVKTLLCNNNTFTGNFSLPLWVKSTTRCLRIKNNIFYNNQFSKTPYSKLLYLEANEPYYRVTNNCCFGNTQDNFGLCFNYGNKIADPKLTTYTDVDPCSPMWTENVKSPCIDFADPDTDEDMINWYTDKDDQDADGTRKDIGAKPGRRHTSYIMNLTNEPKNCINWVCFPLLDKMYKGKPRVDAFSYVVDKNNDNYLLSVECMILRSAFHKYNQVEREGIFYLYTSWRNANFELASQIGFKIQLASGVSSYQISDDGFYCGEQGNLDDTIHIKGTLELGSAYNEIWVGYFNRNSVKAMSAFPPDIMNKLIEIKTKNWCMSRDSVNHEWHCASRTPKFNFGEAVVLKYVGALASDFTWQKDLSKDSKPYVEPVPRHFDYKENFDYVPLYVDLAGYKGILNNAKSEMGLFINGKCYGAEVISGDIVQINAYVQEIQELANASVEIKYWDGNENSNDKKLEGYVLYNEDSRCYEKRALQFNTIKPFYSISFNPTEVISASDPTASSVGTNSK